MRKPDPALTLPAFARMPRAIMHAPGLFRSPESAAREDSFELTHTIEPQDFHFAGPILGGNDLWVLLGIVSRARLDPRHRPPEGSQLARLRALAGVCARVQLSHAELAATIGLRGNSAPGLIRQSLQRLCRIRLTVVKAGEALTMPLLRMVDTSGADAKRTSLTIELCPVLTLALLGEDGRYLRVDMKEVRALKSNPVRVLFGRLHWINAGGERSAGLETLERYIWPDEAPSQDAKRRRRARLLRVLQELDKVLRWTTRMIPHTGQVKIRRRDNYDWARRHADARRAARARTSSGGGAAPA